MDVATIKGVVDRLVARNLVQTAPDTRDGRRLILSLTPAGLETIKETRCRRHQWFASRLETLTDDERLDKEGKLANYASTHDIGKLGTGHLRHGLIGDYEVDVPLSEER